MVCGFGEEVVPYDTLVAKLAKAQLDKSSRFTDWARRLLTDAQVRYALGDVTHLRVIYDKLAARIDEADGLGRRGVRGLARPPALRAAAWRRRGAGSRCAPATPASSPSSGRWPLGASGRKPGAATCRGADHPRRPPDGGGGQPAADGRAAAPAARQPRPGERRRRRGGDRGRPGAPGRAAAAFEEPKGTAARHRGPTVDLLRVLLKLRSEENEVAQRLAAGSADLEAIACWTTRPTPALHGWRREIFGEDALALKAGRLAPCAAAGRRSSGSTAPKLHDEPDPGGRPRLRRPRLAETLNPGEGRLVDHGACRDPWPAARRLPSCSPSRDPARPRAGGSRTT